MSVSQQPSPPATHLVQVPEQREVQQYVQQQHAVHGGGTSTVGQGQGQVRGQAIKTQASLTLAAAAKAVDAVSHAGHAVPLPHLNWYSTVTGSAMVAQVSPCCTVSCFTCSTQDGWQPAALQFQPPHLLIN